MIRGRVDDLREAVVELRVFGPAGALDVKAVIDTGFTSSLTLPTDTVKALGLQPAYLSSAIMADGTEHQFDMYPAEVDWGGSRRAILVSGIGYEVLLGMTLLDGHSLSVDVTPGGAVEIRPLP
jgi:clan AA aspartic protease